jgi:hypothetical protein
MTYFEIYNNPIAGKSTNSISEHLENWLHRLQIKASVSSLGYASVPYGTTDPNGKRGKHRRHSIYFTFTALNHIDIGKAVADQQQDLLRT